MSVTVFVQFAVFFCFTFHIFCSKMKYEIKKFLRQKIYDAVGQR